MKTLTIDFETKDPYIGEGLGSGWCYPGDKFKVLGASVKWDDGETSYIMPGLLPSISADYIIMHNATYDLGCLRKLGLTEEQIKPLNFIDTEVMGRLFDSSLMSYALDNLAKKYLNHKKDNQVLIDAIRKSSLVSYTKVHLSMLIDFYESVSEEHKDNWDLHLKCDEYLNRAAVIRNLKKQLQIVDSDSCENVRIKKEIDKETKLLDGCNKKLGTALMQVYFTSNVIKEDNPSFFKCLDKSITAWETRALKWAKSNMDILQEHCYDAVEQYANMDVDLTYKLFRFYMDNCESRGWNKDEFLALTVKYSNVAKITTSYRSRGVRVDLKRCREIIQELRPMIASLYDEVYTIAGEQFNLKSPIDMPRIFDKLGIDYPKTEAGNASITSPWMEQQDHPICKSIVKARKYKNINDNFIQKILDMQPLCLDKSQEETDGLDFGMVYPELNLLRARTGRFSCSSPNLQQIPSRDEYLAPLCRSIFVAHDGEQIYSLDYSNQEGRLQVHYANRLNCEGASLLVEEFKANPKFDMHQKVADMVGVSRTEAKAINLGISYGMGVAKLAKQLDIDSDSAYVLRSKYNDLAPFLQQLNQTCINTMKQRGYIKTLGGRRSSADQPFYKNGERITFEYKALNKLIQGCLKFDTKVLTREGLFEIQELAGKSVEIWDGQEFVKGICLPSGKKQKCIIEFTDGSILETSPDHRLLTINSAGSEKWRRTGEIDKVDNLLVKTTNESVLGDTLNIPEFGPTLNKTKNSYPGNFDPVSFSEIGNDLQLGELLGRIASDGSVFKEKNVSLLFAEHEKEVEEYMLPLIYRLGKPTITRKINADQEVVRYMLNKTSLAKQCQDMELKTDVPYHCWTNKELMRGYLRGMFDGDGGVGEKGHVVLTFGKQEYKINWARNIQLALRMFGISSRVRHYPGDRTVVHVIVNHSSLFKKEIGFINSKKHNKLLEEPTRAHRQGTKIKKITVTDDYVEMYDICNTKNERFMANGYIVHNSAADQTIEAMIQAYEKNIPVLFPVHDQFLISGTKQQAIDLCNIMESAILLDIPVVVDVELEGGFRWSEAGH